MNNETTTEVVSTPAESASPVISTPIAGLPINDPTIGSDPSIKDFKSVDDLAKSYIHARSVLGRSIRIPTADTAPEEAAEFFNKLTSVPGVMKFDEDNPSEVYARLGRPEKPEDYKLNFAEGVEVDPNVTKDFFNTAHGLGLNNKQVQALVDYKLNAEQADMAQTQQQVANYEQMIKQEFGPEYNNRLAAAKEAVRLYSAKYPDLQDLMNNPVVGSHPAIVSIFAELGKQAIEQKLPGVTTGVSFGTSSAEALDKINEIRGNRTHPYHDPKNPAHASAVSKMEEYYKIAYGE